jgi:hypothetical protein
VVEETEYGFKTSRLPYSTRGLTAWGALSLLITIACYLVRPVVDDVGDFSTLVDTVNVVAYVFIVGIPVFLPAGIVFGTSNGKEHISRLLSSEKRPVEVFLRSLMKMYALVFLFSLLLSVALFYYPLLSGSSSASYLPPVFVATLIVSLFLASIGAIFVMITDEPIVSTSIGCVLTVSLAVLFGWNSRALWDSVTRSLAILSPSNLVRIFAGLLSNYSPDTDYSYEYHEVFGFTSTMNSVVLVLTLFGALIVIGFIVSIKSLQRNSSFWNQERDLRKVRIWEAEKEYRRNIAGLRRRYVKRSSIVVGLIIIVLAVAIVGKNSYAGMVIQNATFVFHQSPEMGERIDLGEWYIFSCEVQPAQYDLPNILHYSFEIRDWMAHECPSELTFLYSMLNMSSSEFQDCNETERRLQCRARNRTLGEFGGSSGAIDLGLYYGSFAYVIKVIAAENETTSGFLYTLITLYQCPTTSWHP